MQNPSSPRILLASSSRYRQGLLNRFLDDYETVSPGVDESALDGEAPEALATRLARAKADASAGRFKLREARAHDAVVEARGLEYRPLLAEALLRRGLSETGKAIVMAALSTIMGFGSLSLSHYPGLRSIGLLAVVGLICTWATALILLPGMPRCSRPLPRRASSPSGN